MKECKVSKSNKSKNSKGTERKYEFQSAPPTEEAWKMFQAALAVALGDLDEDEFLVISAKNMSYFVQFAAQGAYGMRVEAISNAYIMDEDHELSEEEYQKLLDLGWNAPTYEPDDGLELDPPAEGSSNFYLDVATPVPYPTVAALAVDTLGQIYQVRYPGELQYRGYSTDDVSIRFPLLGIKRSVD
jgi:hypothetical protein